MLTDAERCWSDGVVQREVNGGRCKDPGCPLSLIPLSPPPFLAQVPEGHAGPVCGE